MPNKNKTIGSSNLTKQQFLLRSVQNKKKLKSCKRNLVLNFPKNSTVERLTMPNKRKAKLEEEMEKKRKEKERFEMEECTFTPKINRYKNKRYEHKKSSSIDGSTFYEKNIKWLNRIKGKQARARQIEEINKCDYTFQPSIIENAKIDDLFNNQERLSIWIKYNRLYLSRHMNKNKSTLQNKNKVRLSNPKILNGQPNIPKTTISVNRSMDLLHQELQNTALDDEEDDFNYF